ncbi:MAG: hypothetical protein A2X12_06490 [Bacteroidetes bacterium GWE2_29_8]|nr:MAG: hypothetical protein A2X12_06490 [Bacteroidetes bacterium GWE2_29_8]
MKNQTIKPIIYFFILVFFYSCNNENIEIPKEKSYFRISTPKNEYTKYHYKNRYSFYKSTLAEIVYDTIETRHKDWININYPKYSAKIHISYKVVNNNLNEYLDDSQNFVSKQIQKSTGINETVLGYPNKKVYGIIYDIGGSNVASPIQFYFTDSTNNFIRGSLYFNVFPNNDSLEPIIDFIKKDIYNIANSLEWLE